MLINTHTKDILQEIFNILAQKGGEQRLIGGCVRDLILGIKPKDFDIATTLPPETVVQILHENGYKALTVGIKYGTIIAIIENLHIEITTLRTDVKTFGRHAEVVFGTDWIQDAKRRDFTINAMSMDLDGTIYDFFNGKEDLENKIVRFIGDPISRCKEDYLRILRYYRFVSYFGTNKIDRHSLNATQNLASNLPFLSGERIHGELKRILHSPFAKESIMLMDQHGILKHLGIGKIKQSNFHFDQDTLVNLAILLYVCQNTLENAIHILKTLKFSNVEIKTIRSLLSLTSQYLEIHKLKQDYFFRHTIYYSGRKLYNQLLALFNCLRIEYIDRQYEVLPLPITSDELKHLGFNGESLGIAKKKAEGIWLKNACAMSKEELLQTVQNLMR